MHSGSEQPAWSLHVSPAQLRSEFALRLALLYGQEVPGYNILVAVSRQINSGILAKKGASAHRLGSIERVTAERHCAIRLGTPGELEQAGGIFAAMGMFPVGFYDLRSAESPVPVVSTAFRPTSEEELASNPFRVFTSLLAISDRQYFDPDLQARIMDRLAQRVIFPPELLALAERAEKDNGLPPAAAGRFLDLATSAFRLSASPLDGAWYRELSAISDVAADIAGGDSTHINHLTPRVLDIDLLQERMQERGITMIDAIQGPPAAAVPSVLLRQTSFRAIAERRMMREPDGSVTASCLRVRFGEVESRGIALTPAGRERYELAMSEIRGLREPTGPDGRPSADVVASLWARHLPPTEDELRQHDLAYFTYDRGSRSGAIPRAPLANLVRDGWIAANPVVYEDFLPRSAAGIFASNLTGTTRKAASGQSDAHYDAAWMSGVLGRHIHDPYALYQAQSDRSIARLMSAE